MDRSFKDGTFWRAEAGKVGDILRIADNQTERSSSGVDRFLSDALQKTGFGRLAVFGFGLLAIGVDAMEVDDGLIAFPAFELDGKGAAGSVLKLAPGKAAASRGRISAAKLASVLGAAKQASGKPRKTTATAPRIRVAIDIGQASPACVFAPMLGAQAAEV